MKQNRNSRLIERYICIHYLINRYIFFLNCLCGSVTKASDTQAVGYGFEPHPDH